MAEASAYPIDIDRRTKQERGNGARPRADAIEVGISPALIAQQFKGCV